MGRVFVVLCCDVSTNITDKSVAKRLILIEIIADRCIIYIKKMSTPDFSSYTPHDYLEFMRRRLTGRPILSELDETMTKIALMQFKTGFLVYKKETALPVTFAHDPYAAMEYRLIKEIIMERWNGKSDLSWVWNKEPDSSCVCIIL